MGGVRIPLLLLLLMLLLLMLLLLLGCHPAVVGFVSRERISVLRMEAVASVLVVNRLQIANIKNKIR